MSNLIEYLSANLFDGDEPRDWKAITINGEALLEVLTDYIDEMERAEEEEYHIECCYECGGYGDDYRMDENGDLVSNCEDCPHNRMNWED